MRIPLSMIGAFISLLFLTDCASFSSFQTAKTLPRDEFAGTAGFGYNNLGNESYVDLALRMGIRNASDLGLKFNYTTFGSSVIMFDWKHELPSNTLNFYRSVGFGLSSIASDDKGFAIHLPAYFSFHTSNELVTTYINPRVFYYVDLLENSEFNNSGLAGGTSLGVKIGRKFSILPEWSCWVGKYNDDVKINNLFSVGLGFNLK